MVTVLPEAPRDGRAPAPARLAPRPRGALLLLCLLLPLLPFLAAPAFPTQDGPAHVGTAQRLALIRAGQAPLAAAFLEEHDPGLTNVVAPWVLSRLLEAMPPVRAEWTMALGLTLLLLGAVLLALRLLRGRASDAALGALLCAPLMLYMGSFSLVLGMVCGFAALAFAARHLATGRAASALLFAVATLLGCIANIQVAVPVLAGVFGGVAGAALWRRWRGAPLVLAGPEVALLLAAVPVIALVGLYGLRMPGGTADGAFWFFRRQVATLLLRGDAAWFWHSDLLLLGALNLLLLAAMLRWLAGGGRAGTPVAPWAAFGAGAIALLVLILPLDTMAAPQIPMRLAPFLQFLLFFWFITAAQSPAWRGAVLALALAAGLSQAATRSWGHARLADRIAELTAMEALIPAGSVIDMVRIPWLAADPAVVAPDDTPAHRIGGFRLRFTPFAYAGRGLGGSDVVDFGNLQVMPRWRIFRLRPRPALAAVTGLGLLDWRLNDGAIPGGLPQHRAELRAAAGRDLDYVIVWNSGLDAAARARSDPRTAAVLRELEAGFAPVARSSPAGLAELWQRRDDAPAAPR